MDAVGQRHPRLHPALSTEPHADRDRGGATSPAGGIAGPR
jgi:hypothetical protein